MQAKTTLIEPIRVIGISVRTNNKNEANPSLAKIPALAAHYHSENIAYHIPKRSNPSVMIAGYTEYQSDEEGDYTYFIGEEVSSLDYVPPHLFCIEIPGGKYQRFSTEKGKFPDVLISAWQKIWQLPKSELRQQRSYLTDFEIYDFKNQDQENMSVDIYIGIM